jgi:fructose-1,6-bisphosphatase
MAPCNVCVKKITTSGYMKKMDDHLVEFSQQCCCRVLYEVFPMSFLMEQAGGQAFTGKGRALDIVPKKIHDRSPIFLGSYDDIEDIKNLYAACAKETF